MYVKNTFGILRNTRPYSTPSGHNPGIRAISMSDIPNFGCGNRTDTRSATFLCCSNYRRIWASSLRCCFFRASITTSKSLCFFCKRIKSLPSCVSTASAYLYLLMNRLIYSWLRVGFPAFVQQTVPSVIDSTQRSSFYLKPCSFKNKRNDFGNSRFDCPFAILSQQYILFLNRDAFLNHKETSGDL